MLDLEHMKITDFIKQLFTCECGQQHSVDMDSIKISSGAINELPDVIESLGYKKVFIVADGNTFKAAGGKVIDCLTQKGIPYVSYILSGETIVPDEKALGGLMMAFDRSCDLIIAVGSGTINDICRFFSSAIGLKYFMVATAPSMDGFVSGVAAMITNNLKTTYNAQVAQAFIGDLDILADAPMDTIVAGVGDILGKYTCLCDWKLSSLINNEYYCKTIVEMVILAVKRVVASKDKLLARDKKAIEGLTEALLLSGIAMSYAGNSRPASGCEHHLSHFWEMRFLFEGKKAVLHGTKVGIGTIAALKVYEYIKSLEMDFEKINEVWKPLSEETWKEEMKQKFKIAADEIILLEEKTKKNDKGKRDARIAVIEKRWPEIYEAINELPSAKEVEKLIADLKGATYPAQVGIDPDIVEESILYAKEIRDRYTVLQLLWDLGVQNAAAKQVTEDICSTC
ncbi:sn-glycerol-1-phosphate dehydrogenase [Cellulosilyticum sp. I15G10I2]|uniref:sn-glycerol-1-phosphate dehydrogenase n=1 Tax=Cellulosilyticum sp. I15G10I2 TaxID=1892843 RepID=UPI00085CB0E9|nr:sn-glycerol-1-phosphate dehydrogenase [Cellulosilyticum sp. I15G10I2]